MIARMTGLLRALPLFSPERQQLVWCALRLYGSGFGNISAQNISQLDPHRRRRRRFATLQVVWQVGACRYRANQCFVKLRHAIAACAAVAASFRWRRTMRAPVRSPSTIRRSKLCRPAFPNTPSMARLFLFAVPRLEHRRRRTLPAARITDSCSLPLPASSSACRTAAQSPSRTLVRQFRRPSATPRSPVQTYALQVDVGQRADQYKGACCALVDLIVNGVVTAATGLTPAPGLFSTWTAVYTAALADAGGAITIRLSDTVQQGDFDEVRLSGVAGEAAPGRPCLPRCRSLPPVSEPRVSPAGAASGKVRPAPPNSNFPLRNSKTAARRSFLCR